MGPNSVSSTALSGMPLVNALSIMLPTYSRRRRSSPPAVLAVSPRASATFCASVVANCCFSIGVSRETCDGISDKPSTTLAICALKCLTSLSLKRAKSFSGVVLRSRVFKTRLVTAPRIILFARICAGCTITSSNSGFLGTARARLSHSPTTS